MGYNKRPDQGGPGGQAKGKPYGGGGRGQGQNRMMGGPMQQHMGGPMQNQMNMQSNQQQMEMMRQ